MKETRNTPRLPREYAGVRRRQARWLWILTAAMVVLCTVCALRRPAIMLEKACGIPEHTHTDACYTQVTVREKKIPVCKAAADMVIHRHDDVCYHENGQLWCTLPEVETHLHTDSCYAAAESHVHTADCYTRQRGGLICTEPTEPAHQHTDACYTETSVLTCTEDHEHGEGCYETARELTCGLAGEPAHVHTDSCYEWTDVLTCERSTEAAPPVLVCGKEEVIPHTHVPYGSEDSCYDAEGNLVCGLPRAVEHQHTDACFETVTETVDTDALTCTQEHAHTARCYGVWELTCGLEEHTHSEECGAEPETTALEETESALTGDAALVTALEVTAQNRECNGLPWLVRSGEAAVYQLSLQAAADGGTAFPAGRVRLELVIPLTAQEGTFDLDAMPWLDGSKDYAPVITEEIRTIGDEALPCQVLTGWLLLTPEGEAPTVSAARSVVIQLLAVEPGREVALQASAAMEYNIWEGICPTHQVTERLTVSAEPFTTACTLEEAETNYVNFLSLLDALEGQENIDEGLLARLTEAYQKGELTEEAYEELYERLFVLLYGSLDSIAERAVGGNWMLLRESGWFEAYSACGNLNAAVQPARAVRLTPTAADSPLDNETHPSDVQIEDWGGGSTNETDGVSVSKTIAGTELENVFDITLQVKTQQKITEITSEPDIAVVIVLDISNTMNSNFGGITRYAAAMRAAESFLDQFAESNSLGVSKIGFVAFNTNATQIFDLQSCKSQNEADALKNRMRTETGNIINYYRINEKNEVIDPERFTNMHAGLRMASNMLNGVKNKNKFIVFLSDGFPTTYSSDSDTDYHGYYTDDTSRFYDYVVNKPCTYGTNYSDTGAVKARQLAETIRNSGTTIFSIGVDVGGQNLQDYIDSASLSTNHHSTVERGGTNYEIGGTDSAAFKNWLRTGIGSGYYYDSTDSDGLTNAFSRIFAEIKTKVEEASRAEWVAADPMPLQSELGHVEFLGFYDRGGTLGSGSLAGISAENGENTAVFQTDDGAIQWNLKASGYRLITSGDVTLYTYQLVYRVRLENEHQEGVSGFEEGRIYPTNGTTTLRYRVVQTVDGVSAISEPRTMDFPTPSVHGYLGELTFSKVDSRGDPLADAEFTLHHDTKMCAICRGDRTPVDISDLTAASDSNGVVAFDGIPSGHLYTLTETKVPDGYAPDGNTYQVRVAYDKLTVTVTGPNEEKIGWDRKITNNPYYELPETGGCGSEVFYGAGLLCLAFAAAAARKRKRVT